MRSKYNSTLSFAEDESAELKFSSIVDNYLKNIEKIETYSIHTLRAYSRDLSLWFEGLAIGTQGELISHIRKVQLSFGHLAPSTKNRRVACLKSFLRYLLAEGHISRDLRHFFTSPRIPKRVPHFISVDEALAVLKLASSQNTKDLKFKRRLFLVLYGCGLRISEACHLKPEDFGFSPRVIRVLGKGGKERLVAIPSLLDHELSNFAKLPNETIWGDKPLNPRTGYRMIQELGVQAGLLRPLHPHALRHSYATHLLTSGANIRVLQELLGHANLAATEKYTHLSIDALARTMERCHPLSKK